MELPLAMIASLDIGVDLGRSVPIPRNARADGAS